MNEFDEDGVLDEREGFPIPPITGSIEVAEDPDFESFSGVGPWFPDAWDE